MLPERLYGSGDPLRLERLDAGVAAEGTVAAAQSGSRGATGHAAGQRVAPGAAELAFRGARRRRVSAPKRPLKARFFFTSLPSQWIKMLIRSKHG